MLDVAREGIKRSEIPISNELIVLELLRRREDEILPHDEEGELLRKLFAMLQLFELFCCRGVEGKKNLPGALCMCSVVGDSTLVIIALGLKIEELKSRDIPGGSIMFDAQKDESGVLAAEVVDGTESPTTSAPTEDDNTSVDNLEPS